MVEECGEKSVIGREMYCHRADERDGETGGKATGTPIHPPALASSAPNLAIGAGNAGKITTNKVVLASHHHSAACPSPHALPRAHPQPRSRAHSSAFTLALPATWCRAAGYLFVLQSLASRLAVFVGNAERVAELFRSLHRLDACPRPALLSMILLNPHHAPP